MSRKQLICVILLSSLILAAPSSRGAEADKVAELTATVEKLKAEIDALKAENAELKQKLAEKEKVGAARLIRRRRLSRWGKRRSWGRISIARQKDGPTRASRTTHWELYTGRPTRRG